MGKTQKSRPAKTFDDDEFELRAGTGKSERPRVSDSESQMYGSDSIEGAGKKEEEVVVTRTWNNERARDVLPERNRDYV